MISKAIQIVDEKKHTEVLTKQLIINNNYDDNEYL